MAEPFSFAACRTTFVPDSDQYEQSYPDNGGKALESTVHAYTISTVTVSISLGKGYVQS